MKFGRIPRSLDNRLIKVLNVPAWVACVSSLVLIPILAATGFAVLLTSAQVIHFLVLPILLPVNLAFLKRGFSMHHNPIGILIGGTDVVFFAVHTIWHYLSGQVPWVPGLPAASIITSSPAFAFFRSRSDFMAILIASGFLIDWLAQRRFKTKQVVRTPDELSARLGIL